MKRLWTAAALLALLLAASLVNAWYAQSLADGLTAQLEQAQAQAENGAWDRAQALTQGAYEEWGRHHFYLHSVLRHSDTDQILRGFRSVLEYLSIQEMDQYAAANADLVTQLELLAEMEQASLVNVL